LTAAATESGLPTEVERDACFVESESNIGKAVRLRKSPACRLQNGLTIAKTTMPIINTVGTSLAIR
jgi:hypothetical protein